MQWRSLKKNNSSGKGLGQKDVLLIVYASSARMHIIVIYAAGILNVSVFALPTRFLLKNSGNYAFQMHNIK
jgi:hypothetical protein